jgi:hypothetical protein
MNRYALTVSLCHFDFWWGLASAAKQCRASQIEFKALLTVSSVARSGASTLVCRLCGITIHMCTRIDASSACTLGPSEITILSLLGRVDDSLIAVLFIFVVFVEISKEIGTSSTSAFLFHSMDGIRDIERLFERGEAGGTADGDTMSGLEQRRIEWVINSGRFGRLNRALSLFAPGMVEELVDGVSLGRVDTQQVSDQVLGRCADVIPPGAQEGIVSPSDFLRQDIDTFVVKRRESAEERVKDTPECPHVDALAIAFVLDNLWGSVADRSARCHCVLVPDNLAESKVGNLDAPDASATETVDEFALVLLFLVVGAVDGVLGWNDGYPLEQEVLWFNVSVDNSTLLVQIADAMGDLEDDVTSQGLTKVCELDNLMEKLSSLHELQHEEIVLVRLGERDKLDNRWMIDSSHDLNLFENIRTLGRARLLLLELGIEVLVSLLLYRGQRYTARVREEKSRGGKTK